jgi:hypothetical protein
LKRIIASLALVFGIGGIFAVAAPSASAAPCIGLHIYVAGHPVIETDGHPICL